MPDQLQPELPLPFPPRADMPARPARMVSEFVYCPTLVIEVTAAQTFSMSRGGRPGT